MPAITRLLAALLLTLGLGCIAHSDDMPLLGASTSKTAAAASYTGPGDITTYAAFWSFRAYSAAKAAALTSVIQVTRDSDSVTMDIPVTAAGNLNTTTLNTFLGAGTGHVTKFYDQTGNGFTLTHATGLQINISNGSVGITSGLPYVTSTAAFTGFAITTGPTLSLTWSLNAVVMPSNVTPYGAYLTDDANNNYLAAWVQTGGWGVFGGNSPGGTAVNNTWYSAFATIASGPLNKVYANNSLQVTYSTGGTGIQVGKMVNFGGDSFATDGWAGNLVEAGFINSDVTSSISALTSNQRTYWGF